MSRDTLRARALYEQQAAACLDAVSAVIDAHMAGLPGLAEDSVAAARFWEDQAQAERFRARVWTSGGESVERIRGVAGDACALLDAVGSHSPLSARPRIAAISEELAAARRAADAEAPLTQQDRDALLAAGRVELARRQGST